MKNYLVSFFFILVLSSVTVFARNPWLTATTVNGQTRPVSAGMDEVRLEVMPTDGMLLRSSGSSSESGGRRFFNLVISHWGTLTGTMMAISKRRTNLNGQRKTRLKKSFRFVRDAS